MSSPTVLITGDIVLDCNLYGSIKAAAAPFSGPCAGYREELGGAVLTSNLLLAAAAADGLAWDALKRIWNAENKGRRKRRTKPLPRPDELAASRPAMAYGVHLDLDTKDLKKSLPPHLRSYGVWTDQPAKRGVTKDRVWRVGDAFGYGSTEPARQGGVFTRTANRPDGDVALTIIDDGGILFRHGPSKAVWPVDDSTQGSWFLLKMSWPLCRGDLWAALDPMMDRLIVIVSAADLRREDVQVNPRLSWERCVEHSIHALCSDPIAGDLLRAAHVIINYESEGALWFERRSGVDSSKWRLIFTPNMLEGDYGQHFDGTTYGFQTCLAVGVAHQLMARHAGSRQAAQPPSPFVDAAAMRQAIEEGIAAGLATRRLLIALGHGVVGRQAPCVPVEELGRSAANSATRQGGFVKVEVPEAAHEERHCQWTILRQSEEGPATGVSSPSTLTGLAQLTALHGPGGALSHLPALRLGSLFTVDRTEIEDLRALEALIGKYERDKVQTKPLSIGVFGPPGAGKSFSVKALAKVVLGEESPFLEFNLSQFKSPDELIGAFHRVRDAVLGGTTPVAFWDEFDSQDYRWLQYLLAPMQDGAFQEGQITHPIGKCVFIFAGGTARVLEEFGVAEPRPLIESELASLDTEDRAERRRAHREHCERYRRFVLLKGPDFVSRLHGFLNVLGPNPRIDAKCPDITWPIRRALILRGILRLNDSEVLDIDRGLLNALLAVPIYRYGARSFEKIVNALNQGREFGRLSRSALPPKALLDRETDAEAFHSLLTAADAFKKLPDLEALAAAIHHNFLDQARKSKIAAEAAANPVKAWEVDPAIMRSYEGLDSDSKASNRAAARRIPEHLALIGYVLEQQQQGDTSDWQAPLKASIEQHLERLARAEHLDWCAERRANGWTYAKERNNTLKHHPLLLDWSALSPTNQDKDRSSVRAIPELLEVARFRAVPVRAGT